MSADAQAAPRTCALWIPDWPVLAAMGCRDIPAHVPAAIHDGRRIIASSAPARGFGVRRGMRRRQARQCCPDLVFLDADEVRDAREFEPVALAAETVVAGLEIARPGLLLLPASGPSRYHGSDEQLAESLIERVGERTGHECQVGVADGLLAAVLAARQSRVIPPGSSPGFLAPQPVRSLAHAASSASLASAIADLSHLLGRLGIHQLGELAALPSESVAARFGDLGSWARLLAGGGDLRPPGRRRIEPDIEVGVDIDPPAQRVDVATFAGRRLAEELHDLLASRSLVAGRLRITARTGEGEELARTWRVDPGSLLPARITDRVRWQLEGWLTAAASSRQQPPAPGPVTWLGITAAEVVPAGAEQPRLWGASAGEDARARRALGRVQGLLGGDAVLTAQVQGGRDPRERIRLAPFGEDAALPRDPALPWPGRLPSPAPATLYADPEEAVLVDAAGRQVTLDERQVLSAPPAVLRRGGASADVVRDWAGPWPLAERWWSPAPTRRAHLQVLLADGGGLLLSCTAGTWRVEGQYD